MHQKLNVNIEYTNGLHVSLFDKHDAYISHQTDWYNFLEKTANLNNYYLTMGFINSKLVARKQTLLVQKNKFLYLFTSILLIFSNILQENMPNDTCLPLQKFQNKSKYYQNERVHDQNERRYPELEKNYLQTERGNFAGYNQNNLIERFKSMNIARDNAE